MTEKTNHFRARILIILRQRGWSFNEFARQLGKTTPRVRDVVMRGDPKTSVLKEYAEALGVAPEELMEEVTPEEYGEVMLPTFEEENSIAN